MDNNMIRKVHKKDINKSVEHTHKGYFKSNIKDHQVKINFKYKNKIIRS